MRFMSCGAWLGDACSLLQLALGSGWSIGEWFGRRELIHASALAANKTDVMWALLGISMSSMLRGELACNSPELQGSLVVVMHHAYTGQHKHV